MSYTINNYNGTILSNVADGTLDTTTSIKLAGRNYAGYGEILNENLLWLLQHFANSSAPSNPVAGQLWFNSTYQTINIYTGSDWITLATTNQLNGSSDGIYDAINQQIGLVNANIISNVATLTSNAASQQGELSTLWANAVSQQDQIESILVELGAAQGNVGNLTNESESISGRLALVNANVAAANAAIELKANIDSPSFTGVPVSITPTIGDRTTKIATTAYVMTQDDLRRGYVDSVISSNISSLSSSLSNEISLKAPINSPTFTGTPTAQTPIIGDNSTKLATTGFVMAQDAIRRTYVDTSVSSNISILNSAVNNNLALKAPLLNPVFTGEPKAPTPPIGDASTKIATTSFVAQTVGGLKSTWQGSSKFVSTLPPSNSQGNDGDFWFQYL